ncbi:MAG: DUF1080 domain-containing protein [Acidobacteriota bacterium]|nr:DUF1080 domain-containing protein [Acidobacteriota bacterium]
MTILLLVLGLLTQAQAGPRPLPFSDKGWDLRGDGTAIGHVDGREALDVRTGFGFRRDVRLEDGTIEFDVKLTDARSFVYLYFRAESDGEREEVYLRPHKSTLPDALQYAPVWQDNSAWQLYHGPGGTAATRFEAGVWTHVKLVVQGRSAAFFVNDMNRPAMVVPRMAREPRAGYIALGGFLPANVAIDGPIARFSNVVIHPGHVPFDFAAALAASDAAKPVPVDSGVIREWAVSQAFAPADTAGTPALPQASTLGTFQTVTADAGGLVPLDRHVRLADGQSVSAAVARVTVRATEAGVRAFDLGFSDVATVFLNGAPVFRGDGRYSFDRPRREGLIGFDNARLYLPLRAGDNDLAIVVTDTFGGWGLMGRFVDAQGIEVRAR